MINFPSISIGCLSCVTSFIINVLFQWLVKACYYYATTTTTTTSTTSGASPLMLPRLTTVLPKLTQQISLTFFRYAYSLHNIASLTQNLIIDYPRPPLLGVIGGEAMGIIKLIHLVYRNTQ